MIILQNWCLAQTRSAIGFENFVFTVREGYMHEESTYYMWDQEVDMSKGRSFGR